MIPKGLKIRFYEICPVDGGFKMVLVKLDYNSRKTTFMYNMPEHVELDKETLWQEIMIDDQLVYSRKYASNNLALTYEGWLNEVGERDSEIARLRYTEICRRHEAIVALLGQDAYNDAVLSM